MSLEGQSDHLHSVIWLRTLEGEVPHLKYFNHCFCYCLFAHVQARIPHYASEMNFVASVLSFYLSVGSRDQIRLSGLQGKHFTHRASPASYTLKESASIFLLSSLGLLYNIATGSGALTAEIAIDRKNRALGSEMHLCVNPFLLPPWFLDLARKGERTFHESFGALKHMERKSCLLVHIPEVNSR